MANKKDTRKQDFKNIKVFYLFCKQNEAKTYNDSTLYVFCCIKIIGIIKINSVTLKIDKTQIKVKFLKDMNFVHC